MEAVLPVEYVDFDHTVEETGDVSQMSAEEYLSWVRHQASQLPSVFVANITTVIPTRQSKYMPVVEDIMQCPDEYLPNEEWEIDILHSFSQLRTTIGRMRVSEASRERIIVVPQMKDIAAWHSFCLASDLDGELQTSSLSPDEWSSNITDNVTDSSTGPSTTNEEANVEMSTNDVNKRKRQLEQTLGLASGTINSALINTNSEENDGDDNENNDNEDDEYCFPDTNQALAHVSEDTLPVWTGEVNVAPSTTLLLQLDQVLTQKVLGYHVDWLQERSLTAASGQWLYGLLSRLEKPVCQATVAIIRQLYRRCCALRAILATQHQCGEASSSCDTDLAALNVLISITGSYFGQGEAYVAFNHTNHVKMTQQDEGEEEDEDEEDEEEEYFNEMEKMMEEEGIDVMSGKRVKVNETEHHNAQNGLHGAQQAQEMQHREETQEVTMTTESTAVTVPSAVVKVESNVGKVLSRAVVSAEREEGEEEEEEESEEVL